MVSNIDHSNSRGKEFDREEQARWEYDRNCDDETVEHLPCKAQVSLSVGISFQTLGFPKVFILFSQLNLA